MVAIEKRAFHSLVRLSFLLAAMPIAFSAQAQDASYADSQACLECHEEAFESYRRSAHFLTESDSASSEMTACQSCHGASALHVETAGEQATGFSWSTASVEEKTARCTDCHGDEPESFTFFASEHMKGSVDCASCHQSHPASSQDLVSDAGQEACMQCHQELKATMQLNERHRMEEGMVECADCHQQHGPTSRSHLGGFKDETCVNCHTDKVGPFVFEHLSQSVEGCSSCHAPHGSVNRHMLSFQNTAELCYSCHVVVPGFHKGFPGAPVRFDSTSVCTNCHSTIHGSNLDPFFLR